MGDGENGLYDLGSKNQIIFYFATHCKVCLKGYYLVLLGSHGLQFASRKLGSFPKWHPITEASKLGTETLKNNFYLKALRLLNSVDLKAIRD